MPDRCSLLTFHPHQVHSFPQVTCIVPTLEHASSNIHSFSTPPPLDLPRIPPPVSRDDRWSPRASFSPTISSSRPVSCGSTQGGDESDHPRSWRRTGANRGDLWKIVSFLQKGVEIPCIESLIRGRSTEERKAWKREARLEADRNACTARIDPLHTRTTRFSLVELHEEASIDASACGSLLPQPRDRPPWRRNSCGGISHPFCRRGFQIALVPLAKVANDRFPRCQHKR